MCNRSSRSGSQQPFTIWGILTEMMMFCAVVYIPALAQVFHHGPINLWPDWAFLLLLAPTLLIADEIRKFFVRKRLARKEPLGTM